MYQSHESYSACGLHSEGTDLLVKLVREAGAGQDPVDIRLAEGDDAKKDEHDPEERAKKEPARRAPRSRDVQRSNRWRELPRNGHLVITPSGPRSTPASRVGAYDTRARTERGSIVAASRPR